MRASFLLGWFLVSTISVLAADPTASVKQGKLSEVRLISVSRLDAKAMAAAKGAPDGLTFHFVVMRKPDAGPLALKETRDFLVVGESYQAKTKAELGKQFEPSTEVNDAGKFFAQHPAFAASAPKEGKALVISVTIGGAKLSFGTNVEVTLHVGAGKQVESFTLGAVVPEK